MNTILQTIKNTAGYPEYVLLPISTYEILKPQIDLTVKQLIPQKDYIDFNPADYIKNKIALIRIQAKITQSDLAKHLKVSQAYISKIENDEYKVTDRLFLKINTAIKKLQQKNLN